MNKDKLSFEKTSNKIERGHIAHLGRLAHLIHQVSEKNDVIQESLQETESWKTFTESYLKPRIELRTGSLCRGKQFEKKEKSRFASMFDDDED